MTSQRKIEANRRNAQRSTGPRSNDGKARASRNAFRHGFEALNASDPLTVEKMRNIADRICDADAGPFAYQQAMVVAECQLLISRVRSARIAAIEKARKTVIPSAIPHYLWATRTAEMCEAVRKGKLAKAIRGLKQMQHGATAGVDEYAKHLESKKRSLAGETICVDGVKTYDAGKRMPRDDTDSLHLALDELLALDRYECRALSRRKGAIRTLAAIRSIAR